MAACTWKTNTQRMQHMLANQPDPLSEADATALHKQHQHLLWDSIPRALMPQFSLVKNIPNESATSIANYVFGERFVTELGVVTRAYDTSKSNELVVIKILDKSNIFSPMELEGIYREVRFLTEVLRHPNIARCREHLHSREFLYMVFDYAGEHNLASWLPLQPGSRFQERDEVLQCFKETATGLAYCHSKDAAHRNITLKHVVIQANPNGKFHCTIVDFRRAMVVRGNTPSTIQVGTLPYTALEAISGSYRPVCADCWSMGILLLEMAGGIGSTFAATGTNIQSVPRLFKLSAENVFLQGLSNGKALTVLGAKHDAEICSLLDALLTIDPEQRGTMQSVLDMMSSQA
mmetsp:Transcript_58680/g.107316  ORF Transcript_58680/g.107316 Transcript_58680/m.107316 type:complete len:348 (+) Transcript_58680:1-1044(+)